MKTLEYFDHPVKKQNIEYFVQLVRIALADDIITTNEMELLHRIGKRLGFTEPEIVNIIETTGKSYYIPPYELSARFEQVYDIVNMTLADGVIDKNEMRLASSFAANSGFKESEIPNLLILLINGIKQGSDHEDLFEVYKKQRKP
jgi:uncharacterized tellurite resistance protein B-like protein